MRKVFLIPTEDVAGIDFILYIVQAGIVTVGDDGLAAGLEGFEVVHYPATEESGSVFERRFVDNHLGSLGLDAFHDTLNGALTEIIAIRFHR